MTPEEVEEWASRVEKTTFGFHEAAQKEFTAMEKNFLLQTWINSNYDDVGIAALIRSRYLPLAKSGEEE